MPEERIEVKYGGLYHDIKRNFRLIALALLVLIVGIISFVYRVNAIGWFALMLFFSLAPSYFMWARLLKPEGSIFLEVNIRKRLVEPVLIPRELWRREKWKVDKANIGFSDSEGVEVFFAREVDEEKRVVRTTWLHSLSDLEFAERAEAWNELVKKTEDLIENSLRYKLALLVLSKYYGHEMASMPADTIIKIVEKKLSDEEVSRLRRVLLDKRG